MNVRISPLKASLVTTIAAVALVACAGGVTVAREDIATSYEPNELYVVATGRNELRTVIVGEPFDMPKAAFERAVLAGLKRQNFGPPLNLSTDPKTEDARKRQVVIAFNLTSAQQADALCTGAGETAAATDTGGNVTVTGVYCYGGGGHITQATARSANVAGADSEQFRRLMSQIAIALFPDENPNRLDDEPECLDC